MSSFVITLGWPWSYDDPKVKAMACFDKIISASSDSPPPFEFELLVAESSNLDGTQVIIYLDSSFSGVPSDFGSHNFYDDLIPWLKQASSGWDENFHGPRNYALDEYWGSLNILKQQRVSP
jgi:hypothetical protein